jgi:hypothetical protein
MLPVSAGQVIHLAKDLNKQYRPLKVRLHSGMPKHPLMAHLLGYEPYLDDVPNAQLNGPDGFLAQVLYDLTVGQPELLVDDVGGLHVFPNPVIDELVILLPATTLIGRIEIVDNLGRMVHSEGLRPTDRITYGVGQLANGSYTVVLRTAQRVWTARFVKSW